MRISRRSVLDVALRAATVGALLQLFGCSSSRGPKGAEAGLDPWEGQLQELFDDQIHPAAVGLSMDSQSPARDPLLRLRTSNADVVGRFKVQTVTREAVGARVVFLLGVELLGPPFVRPKIEDTHFELVIKQESSAFGLVQSVEQKWREHPREEPFIGFIRRFPGEDGPVLHWHLTAATDEVAQVVQEMAVLDDAGGTTR